MKLDRKLVAVIATAVAFGVLMAVIKGQEADVRDAIGNLSAPWMVIAFLAGTRYRTPGHGALAGLIATAAAVLGFYAAEAFVLDLGDHPWYEDLRLTLSSGHAYEAGGCLTGPVFGTLGAVWKERRFKPALLAVAGVFILEPPIVLALEHAGVWGGGDGLLDYPALWITELAIGLIGAAFTVSRPEPG